jgi:hypothetical protein
MMYTRAPAAGSYIARPAVKRQDYFENADLYTVQLFAGYPLGATSCTTTRHV